MGAEAIKSEFLGGRVAVFECAMSKEEKGAGMTQLKGVFLQVATFKPEDRISSDERRRQRRHTVMSLKGPSCKPCKYQAARVIGQNREH